MAKTFDQGKEDITKLCLYFATNRQSFLAPGAKEAHIRQNLIDPFFEALGWDTRNIAMIAPQYREVVLEDSLDVEGHQKAPDYAFRVGALPKFYVEAKKCGMNIDADFGSAFQLRRYGWSAKLALSILTNFEELSVYDCTIRPRSSDKASHARIQYFRFEEYSDRWRELWDIFSREAVWSGAFDQYATSKRKRGTSEVDVEFLKEIEGWRDILARNIALRNTDLSSDDLNAAVQLTIDRVVFLRMAEDRGLESEQQLLKLCEQPDIYSRFMRDLCCRADEKYNSGLFHFQKEIGVSEDPDQITPKLVVDDKVFKPIIESLYFAHGSPYHFGVLPVEILGTVYERFLGKVIRLTAGHQAKVEEKPEVRKAGGVYYTPTYIVDYIVKHTVAQQIEGRSPAQLSGSVGVRASASGCQDSDATFRVLDMACGSGSFLLGAYQCLLDHCLKWYIEHKPQKFKKAVYNDPRNGQWRLTIEEKKRILTTHIFGVDIDSQAVEVSKLSLLLKVLEGESDQSWHMNQFAYGDRALPNLAENIKCGNSLIGPDYFTDKLIVDPDEMKRINAFDWKQGFPDAMKAGGFECIIGNPPWGGDIDRELEYFHARYPNSTKDHTDSFKLFIDHAIEMAKCSVAMIVPNTILRQRRIWDLRRLMLRYSLMALVDLGENVFSRVVAPSCIFVLQKRTARKNHRTSVIELSQLDFSAKKAAIKEVQRHIRNIRQAQFEQNPENEFSFSLKLANERVVCLGAFDELECKDAGINYQRVRVGMQEKGKSDLAERLLYNGLRKSVDDMMFWKGADIDRFWIAEQTNRFCRTRYKRFIRSNEVVHLNKVIYATVPKILLRQTADRIIAAVDYRGIWFGRSIIAITLVPSSRYRIEYFLGILNSRYMVYTYRSLVKEVGRVFAQVKLSKLKQLPIRPIEFNKRKERGVHDRIVSLVTSMQTLHKHLAVANSVAQKNIIQRQIDAMDAEIDRLVYDLYGLTAKEIALVEGAR
ncbi:MAG: N-6 DNA methylase [Planctomycetota bacterium]